MDLTKLTPREQEAFRVEEEGKAKGLTVARFSSYRGDN